MLVPIGTDLWVADGGIVDFHGAPYPTRMAVIRLANGELWVWSPIELNERLSSEVGALGPVRHLVSPNRLHFLFLAEWKRAFPKARLWGTRPTMARCDDLRFEMPLGDAPPAAWAGQIDQYLFDNSPIVDELIFFHRLSKTVLIADLSQTFTEDFLRRHWPWWLRPIARWSRMVEGTGHPPIDYRLSFRHRRTARPKIRELLGKEPTRVVVAHGALPEGNGAAFLRRAFDWLL